MHRYIVIFGMCCFIGLLSYKKSNDTVHDKQLQDTDAYQWLLKQDRCTQLVLNKQFDVLLEAIVPDIADASGYGLCKKPEGIDYCKGLKAYIKMNLWMPDLEMHIRQDRYVWFSGWWPHSAMERGFIWCDLKDKIGIAVIGHRDYKLSWRAEGLSESEFPNTIYGYSRTIAADKLPQAFFAALAQWIQHSEIAAENFIFVDRNGKCTTIKQGTP